MKNYKQNFLEYKVSNISMEEMMMEIVRYKSEIFSGLKLIYVLNTNKIFLMDKNTDLKRIGQNADFVIAEQAIVIAARCFGNSLKERVSGVELMGRILESSKEYGLRLFFLGADEKVNDKLYEQCTKKYSGIQIVGRQNGYFKNDSNIISIINSLNVDVLFVALGSPKQELWIAQNRMQIKAKFAIGVGGSFDVHSGLKREAPQWTRHGFEWLYRSFQSPKIYLKRYMVVNTYFLYKLIKFIFSPSISQKQRKKNDT